MWIPRLFAAILALILAAGAGAVCAQDYPTKPIRIVTAVAGGGGDFTARQIAQGIAGPLGQPVIVENRTAILAAEVVAKAPPDGYTLTVSGGSVWLYPLFRKAPYDVERDLAPITMTERTIYIIAVHPSLPIKSVKDLIALAKSRPGELNYASTGTAGAPHLATELFKSKAGINLVHIPYKGGAAGITATISGEVQVVMNDVVQIAPHVKTGKLRALAVTSAQPSVLAPGLPTVAATGLPGYEVTNMSGLFAPLKTPEAIIRRLNQEIVRVLNAPDVKERFFNAGAEIVASSPEQFGAAVRSEIANYTKVIKEAGIKAD